MVKISEKKPEEQGKVVKFTPVEKGMNRTSLVLVAISTLATGALFALSHYGILPHLSLLILYTPPSAAGGVGITIGMVSLTSSYLRKRRSKEPIENEENKHSKPQVEEKKNVNISSNEELSNESNQDE